MQRFDEWLRYAIDYLTDCQDVARSDRDDLPDPGDGETPNIVADRQRTLDEANALLRVTHAGIQHLVNDERKIRKNRYFERRENLIRAGDAMRERLPAIYERQEAEQDSRAKERIEREAENVASLACATSYWECWGFPPDRKREDGPVGCKRIWRLTELDWKQPDNTPPAHRWGDPEHRIEAFPVCPECGNEGLQPPGPDRFMRDGTSFHPYEAPELEDYDLRPWSRPRPIGFYDERLGEAHKRALRVAADVAPVLAEWGADPLPAPPDPSLLVALEAEAETEAA